MNLFVERDGKRIFAVSTRNNYGEAKLEILLEVECICSDDDDLLVVPIQALIDWNEIALQSRLPMRLYI